MNFVRIPAGRFVMGSALEEGGQDDERPAHAVSVSAFECAVYPVTQEEYAEFLVATSHALPRDWIAPDQPAFRGEQLPATGVSWFDAMAFCAWRASGGEPMRLPTEAEWEYAARGGGLSGRYPFGDDIPSWLPNEGRGPLAAPWPVTLGAPNGFGVCGIGANIHEWCADWHAASYYAVSEMENPTGPPSGTRRASRGGAWRHAVTISRCAQRSKIDPSFRYSDYGFRPVKA